MKSPVEANVSSSYTRFCASSQGLNRLTQQATCQLESRVSVSIHACKLAHPTLRFLFMC